MNMLQFDSEQRIPMTVMYVGVGDPCQWYRTVGGDFMAAHVHERGNVASADEPILEFYRRFPPAVLGQFTGARYYVDHLLQNQERFEEYGLSLHGANPEWNVPAKEMRAILAWAKVLNQG